MSSPSRPLPRLQLASLAWPLMAELGLAIVLGLLGTAWAGRISDTDGGAFSLATQVAAGLFLLFRVVGAGVGVVVTQHLGAGQRAAADRVALAVLGASSWMGAGTALLALLCATPLMRALQAPADVLPLAVGFLQAMAPALLLDAWNASMASVMRAHLRARDTLWVLLVMHGLHLLLAWPLMHGAGPLPALGLPGFALALGLSRLVGMALHLVLWRRVLGLRPRWADWWRLPRRELAAVLQIGAPGAAESALHRLCYTVSVAAAAQLGAAALATHAYVQQLQGVVVMASLALGFAAEIVVSHLVGAGRLRDADRVVQLALRRGLAIALAVSVAVALAAPWLLRWFTRDAAIIAAGTTLLWLAVVMEAGRTVNLVLVNALRGAGDAGFPLRAGMISMPPLLAGAAWVLAVPLGLGLPGLWLAYIADEWLRALLMWRRWSRQHWVPQARSARLRMRRTAGHADPASPVAAG